MSNHTHHDEITNILECLGRSHSVKGEVKDSHLGKILMYLQRTKKEEYQKTLYKLALVCGMNIRYVRENYLKGLELFGIIELSHEKNCVFWNWLGDKNVLNLAVYEETATEYMKRKDIEKKERKKRNNGDGK